LKILSKWRLSVNEVIGIDKQAQTKYLLRMHLYIHIPFCDGKCTYCAFYSEPYSEPKGDQFLSALARELRSIPKADDAVLSTIYFGGGTPSVLSPDQLHRLTRLVTGEYDVAEGAEWTVEGSPNTLTEDKVDVLTEAGVNRISVGIQTFDDSVLSGLDRRHSSREARALLEYLAGVDGLDVGCDLIAGLPGHTQESWKQDLQAICDIGLTHASVYALSLEEGTPMFRRHKNGELTLPTEDDVIDRLDVCRELLAGEGLMRYEVSNYAVQGKECRHNLSYWRGADYFGVGPGASSRVGLIRRTNTPDVDAYIKTDRAPCEEETVSAEDDLQERLMYHFRTSDGVDLERFCEEYGVTAFTKSDWEARLADLCNEGMLAFRDGFHVPTKTGMDFADAIGEVFLD
jgi:oxygen-independent coproporphyrinogen-3 oxidase